MAVQIFLQQKIIKLWKIYKIENAHLIWEMIYIYTKLWTFQEVCFEGNQRLKTIFQSKIFVAMDLVFSTLVPTIFCGWFHFQEELRMAEGFNPKKVKKEIKRVSRFNGNGCFSKFLPHWVINVLENRSNNF